MWSNLLVRSAHCHLPAAVLATGIVIGSDGGSANNTVLATQNSAANNNDRNNNDDPRLFEGQCLKRQLYKPKVPYLAWDYNWDGRMNEHTTLEGHKDGREEAMDHNKTRHIILVRHGQYDERYADDSARKLTDLGKLQARKTGQCLAEIARGAFEWEATRDVDRWYCGPLNMRPKIRVSTMTRAKETAELIAEEMRREFVHGNSKNPLKSTTVGKPDPILNEALPAPMIPIRVDIANAEQEIDIHQERIEKAFQRYFYRDVGEDFNDDSPVVFSDGNNSHEFEVIVCHANVIRYFFCRALQLPPEAWLRLSIFNCSLTYLMIKPNGNVTARMLGDIGHLKYNETTFSNNYGFKW